MPRAFVPALTLLFVATSSFADPVETGPICEIPREYTGADSVQFSAISGWCALEASTTASAKSWEICRDECGPANFNPQCIMPCVNKIFGGIYIETENNCLAFYGFPPRNHFP